MKSDSKQIIQSFLGYNSCVRFDMAMEAAATQTILATVAVTASQLLRCLVLFTVAWLLLLNFNCNYLNINMESKTKTQVVNLTVVRHGQSEANITKTLQVCNIEHHIILRNCFAPLVRRIFIIHLSICGILEDFPTK